MGTVERRIEIIKYLCRKRYAKIKNIVEEFGTCERTVRRDIESLSLFVPLYVKTGRYYGGVYVVGDYTMERMYMSENELSVLSRIQLLVGEQLSDNDNTTLKNVIKKYSKSAPTFQLGH